MIIVKDNFFKDPYAVRSIALKQKYDNITSNYPGLRSFSVPDRIEDYILSQVKHFANDPYLVLQGASFQYVNQDYAEGIFHHDECQYTCVIYLTPNPPVDSGTEVCDLDQTEDNIWDNKRQIRFDHYADPRNLIKRYKYGRILRKVNSHYRPILKLQNRFNRCVIFDGPAYHRAQKFFGTSVKDSRLTIAAFLWYKSPPSVTTQYQSPNNSPISLA